MTIRGRHSTLITRRDICEQHVHFRASLPK